MSNEAQSLVRKLGGSGDFSSSQIMILLLLADHADEKWECWPSLALLCHHSRFSERTVRSSIRALRDKGVLSVREQRSQATGARLENRYRLNKAIIEPFAIRGDQLWEQIKSKRAGRSAAVRSNVLSVSEEPDGFIPDGPSYGVLVAAETYPANTAGYQPATAAGYSEPHVSAPANTAGYPDARQITSGCPANNDQNSMVPFKGTRADLTINHQSSISMEADGKSEPITSDNETTIDDDVPSVKGPAKAEIHRGVNLTQLFDLMPEQLRTLDGSQVRRLIDVVLARAGAAPVKSPLRYVAKACTQDPEGLHWLVLEPETKFAGDFQGSSEASSTVPEPSSSMIAECTEHLWMHKNPEAICPGCAADALAVPEPGQTRPSKPQRGDFRTDIRIKVASAGSSPEAGELPWGPDEEPGF